MLVEDVTPGERLFLLRRRREDTTSHEAAAKEWGVDVKIYRGWEQDVGDPPVAPLDEVRPYEHFALLRRRFGLPRKTMAKDIGISEILLWGMERGLRSCRMLKEYWEG